MVVGARGMVFTSTNPTCCWSGGDVGSTVTLVSVSCQDTDCFATGVDGSVYIRPPLQSGSVGGHGFTGENGVLYGISCPTATICFAVGDYGTIVATTNGGTGWALGPSIGSAEYGVSCPSTTVCVAVGFDGAVAATDNSGTTWSTQSSGTAQSLRSVSCPSTTACFAVGDAGTVIATSNGGTTWSSQTSNTTQALFAISCPSTTTCFAVTNGANFIKTVDGATWSMPAAVGLATGLTGISCPSTTTCFATDADNPTTNLIYSTTNSGGTWTVSFNLANDPNAGITAAFAAIACPSTMNCYAVGGEGLIAATSDGGLNWRTDNVPTAAQLSSISCPGAGNCYASLWQANGSTVLHTIDFGGSWTAQYGGGTNQIAYTSINCGSAMMCVAIGYGGVTSVTNTAGAAWSTQRPTGSTAPVFAMSCTSASDCYAVGADTLLVTHDGGSAWAAQQLNTTDNLVGISCPAANTCFAVGWPGAIYFTGNGGTTWTYESSFLSGADQTLRSVSCSSATTCVAVGTLGTIISTSNGTTWSAESSGTTQFLSGVSCANSSSCVAVGFAGITMTRSGGAWQAYPSGTTQFLHSVSCPAVSTCYAAGDAGTMLFTQNRGASWTAQTSGTTHDLYGVSCTQSTVCLAVGNFGVALITLDGSSWSGLALPTGNALRAAVFQDLNHAWVAGWGGTILANPAITPGCASVSESVTPSSPQFSVDPSSGRQLADRAGLLNHRNLQLEHQRPAGRHLPLYGLGPRHRQRGDVLRQPGLLRRIPPGGHLHADVDGVYVSDRDSRPGIAAAAGTNGDLHRRRRRLPSSAVPVLAPAARCELADREGLLADHDAQLEHRRPGARRLPLYGLGPRREQPGRSVRLAGVQRRVLRRSDLHADRAAVHVGDRRAGTRLTPAGRNQHHVHRRLNRMPESALPVLAPTPGRELAGRAALLDGQHLYLAYRGLRRRRLPLHGLGPRRQQHRHPVQLAGLQRRLLRRPDLHPDQPALHLGQRLPGAGSATAFGHQRHLHRDLDRLPAPALPVLDPAAGRQLADRQGLLEQHHLHLGHHRPGPRQLPLHGLGPRRQQQRNAVQLAGLQRRLLRRPVLWIELTALY
ncbi:MAG: hypothetical protein E6J06_08895 [Chloroflexi bacterium]|nr:MAG: hypothetical protein E6J06_08895 [Chloroflexota bacterium]